jgi:hypothetical protein
MPETELSLPERRIHAELHNCGQSTRFGRVVYKFDRWRVPADVLTARGWRVVKKTTNYFHAEAPTGSAPDDALIMQIDVPTQAQVLDVAQRIHAASPGNAWTATWGECIAEYSPRRRASSWREVNPFTRELIGELHLGSWIEPRFCVGAPGLFQAVVDDVGGANRYSEHVALVEPSAPSLFHGEAISRDIAAETHFAEGNACAFELTRHERSAAARQRCIEHWGVRCCVCGFDFREHYGELGAGYIQVHHLTPLAKIGAEYEVDPIGDLRPICPNCHAMIHRREPPLTIEELRSILVRK